MAKRWTIPFVSKANKQCRIDIYDPGYTGSVTELSTNNANAPGVPAADPFYFEEDDDQDLLNVVRIKTGYINLIETVQDGLADIYPSNMRNRYVEVFYNNTICFRGYIQQQTFENDWQAVPREVSLPVISVLGLTQYIDFYPYRFSEDKPLGYYMLELINAVDSQQNTKYDRVVFPYNVVNFASTIRPTVVSQDNPDFSQAWGASGSPFKGISMYDFLEGLCNAYGWIVHDMPTCVLFTKFDHPMNTNYSYYRLSDLGTASNIQQQTYQQLLDLETVASLSSDDSTITEIPAMRTVTQKFNGDFWSEKTLDYKRARCMSIYTMTRNDEKLFLAFLAYDNSNPFPDVEGTHLLDTNTITSGWIFGTNGINIIDFDSKKRIIMQALSQWASDGDVLFKAHFYERPLYDPAKTEIRGKLKLEMEFSWGDNLTELGRDSYRSSEFTVRLYRGDTLIRGERFSIGSGDYYKKFEYDPQDNTNELRVELVYHNSNVTFVCIDKMRLYYNEYVYSEYLDNNSDQVNIGDTNSMDEGEVDMLISCQRINTNQIGTKVRAPFTYYQYLRNNQTRLQVKMKGDLNDIMSYIDKIQFWKTSWRWRIIALSFHPWDDEWTLTMHRSSTIEQ